MGLCCSKRLRKQLDCAFIPTDIQDMERYRAIRQDGEGYCPMRLSSGLCALHKECGEKALPSICRYYPRAVRQKYSYECSCSASCEKVAEILIYRRDKLVFEEIRLCFDFKLPALTHDQAHSETYKKLRAVCIKLLQDRSMPLKNRLVRLGYFIFEAHKLPFAALGATIEQLAQDSIGIYEQCDALGEGQSGFDTQRKISEWFEDYSVSLNEYRESVERLLSGEAGEQSYATARARFEELFPDWEIVFENLLVNHIFYEQYPFVEGNTNIRDAYSALCGMYAFLRYMTIGYVYGKESVDAFADVIAASFRVIEHSSFYKKVIMMLKAENRAGLNGLLPLLNC